MINHYCKAHNKKLSHFMCHKIDYGFKLYFDRVKFDCGCSESVLKKDQDEAKRINTILTKRGGEK